MDLPQRAAIGVVNGKNEWKGFDVVRRILHQQRPLFEGLSDKGKLPLF